MRQTLLLPAALLLAGAFAAARPALADTEADKRIAAETIMAEATALMGKKDYANACPKLEDVVKLQPYGVGAKMSLGDCYVGLEKYASAYAMYGAAASQAAQANQPDRASSAQDKAKSLEPRLSKLTIEVPPDLQKIEGLVVESNGSPVIRSLFGLAKPVDGGHYVIRATAPGKPPFEKSVDVASEGVSVGVTVAFADAPKVAPKPPGGDPKPPGGGPTGPSPQPDPGASGGLGGVRIGGIIVGSLGVVLAGSGIGVAVSGLSASSDAAAAFDKAVAAHDVPGQAAARADNDSAKSQIAVGWALTGVGGAALVAGVIMVALPKKTAPPAPTTSLLVAPWVGAEGPTGMTLLGRW
ncbi:MAG: hypothetical protein U0414_31345 [Polyangiaceae bacterium]